MLVQAFLVLLKISERSIGELNTVMNRDLDCLKWLLGNKLSFNVVKTQGLVIGSQPKLEENCR